MHFALLCPYEIPEWLNICEPNAVLLPFMITVGTITNKRAGPTLHPPPEVECSFCSLHLINMEKTVGRGRIMI